MNSRSNIVIGAFLCMTAISAFSQKIDNQYEPSETFPFGRPNHVLKEQSMAFDLVIGSCDCRSLTRNTDQSWGDTTNLRWNFKYILNGTAVQDETWQDNDTYASQDLGRRDEG